MIKRYNRVNAAKFADEFFDFKEGLLTALTLNHEAGRKPIHDLQRDHTIDKIQHAKITSIRLAMPKKLMLSSLILFSFTAWLASFDDAPQIAQEKKLIRETLEQTKQINKELEKKINELEKEMNEEEVALLEKSKLKEMIKDLKESKQQKEALRNYARIEKKIRELKKNQSIQKDEQYLALLADQLLEGPSNQSMGKKLSSRKYKEASEELKKMRLKKDSFKELNKDIVKKLSDMGKCMSNSLSSFSGQNSSFSRDSASISESMQRMNQLCRQSEKELLKKGELGKACKSGIKKECKQINQNLNSMCDKLNQLQCKKDFAKKLDKMSRFLSQCQSQVACNKPGLKAGQGTQLSKNEMKTPELEAGQKSQIEAQKGEGRSQRSVEAASSGGGATSRVSQKKDVKYRHTMESLIKRDDIPENLKVGVKNYFTTIHQNNREDL